MIPLTGTSLEETLAQMVLSFSGSGGGSAILDEKTIAENGVYYPRDETPRLDGYNKVTVNVETYEEEYEEMKECCDDVLEVIQQYDPDYDPTDPTAPTIPEEIADVIEGVSGYTFPSGTSYPPIVPTPEQPVIDPITDEDADDGAGVTPELGLILDTAGYPFVTKTSLDVSEGGTYGYTFRPAVRITSSHGVAYYQCANYWSINYWVYKREILGITGISASGNINVLLQHTSTDGTSTTEESIIVGYNNLYGYGTDGDTYKIKNK